ncbi:hypothetical protein LCGC14_1779810 [marine sediment metagenome]|uniref:Uncharacterized protein n=1 Tax=marine sediment metagenome TaxID=412755 RepID=A0A0F9GVP9_9ZZZZ
MKKFMIWLSVIMFVVGLGVVTFWDVPTWRLYTQDWKPLAMTHAENYCTGKIGINTRFMPNDPAVDHCEETSGKDNITPSIAILSGEKIIAIFLMNGFRYIVFKHLAVKPVPCSRALDPFQVGFKHSIDRNRVSRRQKMTRDNRKTPLY